MPNSRRWQHGVARRGWTVHEDLQQAWLRVLQGRRPTSVQWPRARPQQQSFQPGHTAMNEGHSEIPDHEDSRTASFRGCIREADQGQRPRDEDQACTSSFGRHRRSRSRWFAGSVEARRVRHEGDAHPRTSEGVRVILVKGSTAYGGARPEARRGGSQHQRCGEEIGCIEVAGGLHASTTTSTVRMHPQRYRGCRNLCQLQAKLDAQGQDPDVPCVPTVKRFCRSGQVTSITDVRGGDLWSISPRRSPLSQMSQTVTTNGFSE